MKYLRCDSCNFFGVVPTYWEKVKSCDCGNISGRYLIDNECAVIFLKDLSCLKTCRVIGIPNAVVSGEKESDKCGVGDFEQDKQLLVFVGGVIHSNADLIETNEPRIFSILHLLNFIKNFSDSVDFDKYICETLMEKFEDFRKLKDGEQ